MKAFYVIFLSCAALLGGALSAQSPRNNLTSRGNVVNPRFSFAEIIAQIEPLSSGTQDRFARELSNEYRSLAIFRANVIGDYEGAELFARKALLAFYGDRVMPENPGKHNVPGWAVIELSNVHSDIMRIINADMADDFPLLLSELIAKFDCWVNAVAWDPDGEDMRQASVCRERVLKALDISFERMAGRVNCPPPRATRAKGLRLIGQDGGTVPELEQSAMVTLPRWDRRVLINTLPTTEDATVVAIRRATFEMKETLDESKRDMDALFMRNVAEARRLLGEVSEKAAKLEGTAKEAINAKEGWPDKPEYPQRPLRPGKPIQIGDIEGLSRTIVALQISIDAIKGFADKKDIDKIKARLDRIAADLANAGKSSVDDSALLTRLGELENTIADIAERIDGLSGRLAKAEDDFVEEVVGENEPIEPWIFELYFDWGSDKIDPKFLPQIRELAGRVKGQARVEVEGHTDTTGGEELNLQLSLRRARNVARILSQYGIPKQAIVLKPRAFHDLKVPTGMNVKEPANRRVVVR